jgi:hypothetical protein
MENIKPRTENSESDYVTIYVFLLITQLLVIALLLLLNISKVVWQTIEEYQKIIKASIR